jgi:hypothetical protein
VFIEDLVYPSTTTYCTDGVLIHHFLQIMADIIYKKNVLTHSSITDYLRPLSVFYMQGEVITISTATITITARARNGSTTTISWKINYLCL